MPSCASTKSAGCECIAGAPRGAAATAVGSMNASARGVAGASTGGYCGGGACRACCDAAGAAQAQLGRAAVLGLVVVCDVRAAAAPALLSPRTRRHPAPMRAQRRAVARASCGGIKTAACECIAGAPQGAAATGGSMHASGCSGAGASTNGRCASGARCACCDAAGACASAAWP